MIISQGQKQANFLPVIVRRWRANGWIQIRQRIVFSGKSTWNGNWAWTLPLNNKSWNNGQSDTACMFTTWRSYTVQSKYNPNLFDIYFQGPRLTFLGRHQLVTKIIFFFLDGKMWLPKSVNTCKIYSFIAKHKNAKFFKMFLPVKIFLLLNDC